MTIKGFSLIFVDFVHLKALDELHDTLKKDFNLRSSSMGHGYISPFKEDEQESRHTAFTPITSEIPSCCENIWIHSYKIKEIENWGVVLFLAELKKESIVNISNDPNIREKCEKEVREFLEEKFQFNRHESLSDYKGIILDWGLFDEAIELENDDDLVTWLKTKESEIRPFGFNRRAGWVSLLDRNYLIYCEREIELTDSETFPTHYSVISSYEPLWGSTERRKMVMNFGHLGHFTTLFLNEFVTLLLARFVPYFHFSEINKKFSIKKETIENISSASASKRIVHGRNIIMRSYSDQMKQRMDFIKFLEQISKETNFSKKLIRIWEKRLASGASISWNELKERGETPPYEVTLPYPLWWMDEPQIRYTNWGYEGPIIHNLTKSIDSALKSNEVQTKSAEQSQDRFINYISDALSHLNSRIMVRLTAAIVGLTVILILWTSWQELLELFVVISRYLASFYRYIATH